MRFWTLWLAAALLVALAACGSESPGPTDAGEKAATGVEGGTRGPAPDLSDPKEALADQLARLLAGDVEGLRACFTPRLRNRITEEAVEKGREEVGTMSMEDLWASSEESERDGAKAVKVTMKNGRSLTTLLWQDGRWLADTVWFR